MCKASSALHKNLEEKIVHRKEIHQGRVVRFEEVSVQLPDESPAQRDVVLHPGGSAVVAFTAEGEILFVRQFRVALQTVLLEIPAGKLELGEDPALCAKRELEEETGYRAGFIKKLTEIHPTPGFCDEVIHLYYATELIKGSLSTDPDEFLSVEKIPIKEAYQQILQGKISDAKTIIGLFWGMKEWENNNHLDEKMHEQK